MPHLAYGLKVLLRCDVDDKPLLGCTRIVHTAVHTVACGSRVRHAAMQPCSMLYVVLVVSYVLHSLDNNRTVSSVRQLSSAELIA